MEIEGDPHCCELVSACQARRRLPLRLSEIALRAGLASRQVFVPGQERSGVSCVWPPVRRRLGMDTRDKSDFIIPSVLAQSARLRAQLHRVADLHPAQNATS